jgi:hypothetical protein
MGAINEPGCQLRIDLDSGQSIVLKDYNGDECVLSNGMEVSVDEYGQFKPVLLEASTHPSDGAPAAESQHEMRPTAGPTRPVGAPEEASGSNAQPRLSGTSVIVKGRIANLGAAMARLTERSSLQLVQLRGDGRITTTIDQHGRSIKSDLPQIPVPRDGNLRFPRATLTPGTYVIAIQYADLSQKCHPLLCRQDNIVRFTVPDGTKMSQEIDIGDVSVPLVSEEVTEDKKSLLPTFSVLLQGPNEVRIRNPNDFSVTAGIRSADRGKDVTIPANSTRSGYVPDGQYDIFFVYSDKPDALFQGDPFTLNGNGVEIHIVKVVNGNYGIRQVK